MKQIITLLDSGERSKHVYKPFIMGLSNALEEYLSEKGYDPTIDNTYNLFRYSSDVRLENIKYQLEQAKKESVYLIVPGVRKCYDVLSEFIKTYHIGHISEMYLEKSGLLHVKISCHIFNIGMDNKKATAKKEFDAQMERLQEIGLTTNKIYSGKSIEFTESNIEILNKLITDLGGKGIKAKLWNPENKAMVDYLEFFLNPDDILPKSLSKEENEDIKTEILTDDDVLYMKKLIKECHHSIGAINEMPDMLQTCGKIIESIIYDSCKIVDIKTNISTRYEDSFRHERDLNKQIHKIEEELINLSSDIKIKERFNEIVESIEHWSRENLSFIIDEANIQRYGGIYLTFRFLADSHLHEDIMTREALEKTFNCSSFRNSDEEMYIKSSDKNRRIIESIINAKFAGCEFEKWNDQNKGGEMTISSFTILLNNVPTGLEKYVEE